jgi:hypothetical protein
MALSKLIADFKTLEKDGFYSVADIELWIQKTRPDYLEVRKAIPDKHCPICKPSETYLNSESFKSLKWELQEFEKRCFCHWNTYEEFFLDFYEVLVRLLGFHQKETYLHNELEFIEDIDKNSGVIIEWLKKNEKLALDECGSFWCEWLDENFKTISLSFMHFKEFSVCIKAEEFENTIQFLSTFDKLYWQSDLVQK